MGKHVRRRNWKVKDYYFSCPSCGLAIVQGYEDVTGKNDYAEKFAQQIEDLRKCLLIMLFKNQLHFSKLQ